MLYRRFIALEKIMANAIGGFIPICCNCKRIRDSKGAWQPIEHYLMRHTEHEFSHGICPKCRDQLYPELF